MNYYKAMRRLEEDFKNDPAYDKRLDSPKYNKMFKKAYGYDEVANEGYNDVVWQAMFHYQPTSDSYRGDWRSI